MVSLFHRATIKNPEFIIPVM